MRQTLVQAQVQVTDGHVILHRGAQSFVHYASLPSSRNSTDIAHLLIVKDFNANDALVPVGKWVHVAGLLAEPATAADPIIIDANWGQFAEVNHPPTIAEAKFFMTGCVVARDPGRESGITLATETLSGTWSTRYAVV